MPQVPSPPNVPAHRKALPRKVPSPPEARDAGSLPLGGGGLGWGGRGVDARPIAWTDAGSRLQPDSGVRSAAFSRASPPPRPSPFEGEGGSTSSMDGRAGRFRGWGSA